VYPDKFSNNIDNRSRFLSWRIFRHRLDAFSRSLTSAICYQTFTAANASPIFYVTVFLAGYVRDSKKVTRDPAYIQDA